MGAPDPISAFPGRSVRSSVPKRGATGSAWPSLITKAAATVVTCLMCFTSTASATYPDHLIRVIVSAPAGTAPDIVIRLLQPKLSARLGQQIIVENKPGANGSVAAKFIGSAPPDGYSLLVTVAGTMTANPYLYPKTAATAVDDLLPVTKISSNDFFLALNANLKITSLLAFLGHIRANPGKVNVGTTAHGSLPHLSAELLKMMTGLDFAIVKHTGGSSAANAAAGGHVDAVIDAMAVLRPLIEGKQLLPVASTSATRENGSLPSFAESGLPGFAMTGWVGILAPKGTPDLVLSTVQKAVAEVVAHPEVVASLKAMDLRAEASTSDAFAKSILADRERLSSLIAKAGLKIE